MYLDLQIGVPVFIRGRDPLVYQGKTYKQNQHFPWLEINVPYETARSWFQAGLIYHNPELEKQVQVGDRLIEFEGESLEKLVDAINVIVKSRANSTTEFTKKRCKKSKIDEKQRGLIRSFLRNNLWIEEEYYELRDKMLDE